jgi:hypothetical protein
MGFLFYLHDSAVHVFIHLHDEKLSHRSLASLISKNKSTKKKIENILGQTSQNSVHFVDVDVGILIIQSITKSSSF